jgi:glycosyltransferase involved in cell wall biosynthesis
MTVSVIVPTYNYARFLPDALESLRAQTYSDWECIVVDDGSTDDTTAVLRIAAANDGRVRYVSQANAGPSAARNRGIAESVGEYIQFLDADDVLPPTKLETQVRMMEKDPSIGIVYSDARFFQDSPTNLLSYRVPGPRPSTPSDSASPDPLLRALVEYDNIMVVEGPLIRRGAITAVGSLEESLIRGEDWQYWLRCALAGVRFVADSAEERAVRVRLHADSSMRNELAMHTSSLAVRRWLVGQLDDPGLPRLNQVRTNETLARMGVLEGKHGHLRAGIRDLLMAGAAQRSLNWLLLACCLPLLRVPGRNRILALCRRLPRRPARR